MEKFINDAINKYFKTLRLTGSINSSDKYKLYMASCVYSIYKAFGKLVKNEDVDKMTAYIECLAKNNCLFNKKVPNLEYKDSLITIVKNEEITDIKDITLVSSDRKTKKFTDFAVTTDIQMDQYLVGYDQSENSEVAINVSDLGVFWDVDI